MEPNDRTEPINASERFRILPEAMALEDTITSHETPRPDPNPEDGPLRELNELT